MVAPGVNRVVLTVHRSLPVFPEKQTFSVFVGMSQKCQPWKSPLHRDIASGAQRNTHAFRWLFCLLACDWALEESIAVLINNAHET